MSVYYSDDQVTLYHGDCLDVLAELPDNSVDAVVTDPPYGLEFMGKDWDAPWQRGADVNADAGFHGGGISATKNAPSFTGSTNPKCLNCKGTRRGRRDGTALVKVCTCDAPEFPNVRAIEMQAFQTWCQQWATECLRVLKPGGHILAFGGTRTWHRLACAIEDAGFEVRDSLAWLYGSGFPKSLDVSKAIDKAAGERGVVSTTFRSNRRRSADEPDDFRLQPNRHYSDPPLVTDAAKQWQGWGTALKPAFEPVVVARKPIQGTVAANVLAHGTGALNIDGCRVGTPEDKRAAGTKTYQRFDPGSPGKEIQPAPHDGLGRWPTNVVLDGEMADELDRQSGNVRSSGVYNGDGSRQPGLHSTNFGGGHRPTSMYDDQGGSSRFFPTFRYTAKAATAERPSADGVSHPTVKPLELMRWLVRLVTPPNGVVLDPFAGSGTTGEAAIHEHKRAILIEREPTYLPLIKARLGKPMEIGFDFGEPA